MFAVTNAVFGALPLVEVDIGLLADQVGVAAANTLDLGQGVHNLLLAIDVGVEQTQNVLEVALLSRDERCAAVLAGAHRIAAVWRAHTHDGQLVVRLSGRRRGLGRRQCKGLFGVWAAAA